MLSSVLLSLVNVSYQDAFLDSTVPPLIKNPSPVVRTVVTAPRSMYYEYRPSELHLVPFGGISVTHSFLFYILFTSSQCYFLTHVCQFLSQNFLDFYGRTKPRVHDTQPSSACEDSLTSLAYIINIFPSCVLFSSLTLNGTNILLVSFSRSQKFINIQNVSHNYFMFYSLWCWYTV